MRVSSVIGNAIYCKCPTVRLLDGRARTHRCVVITRFSATSAKKSTAFSADVAINQEIRGTIAHLYSLNRMDSSHMVSRMFG